MISFREWQNQKLHSSVKQSAVNPNDPNGISSADFFSNMRFKPGAIRKEMIRKKKKSRKT